METTSLIVLCVMALVVVFSVLGALAAAILLITAVFPARVSTLDGALVAAVSAAVDSLMPGARVTRIEEE